MSDLISRQALCEYALNQKDKSVTPNDIMRFPSAQPEKRTDKCTETHARDLIERQDAIDALHRYFDGMLETDTWSPCDIYGLIEILPSAQPDSKELSSTHKALDTISRQAAIDAHYEYCNKHPDAGFPVWSLKILEDLPSAQPEIVRCKDCKHHWTHRCMDSMPTEICELGQTFYDANVDFCSLAERRTDESD